MRLTEVADAVVLWFRQDLRLSDQAALAVAAAEGPVIPVYVLDDDGPGQWRIGAAQRWWLHHSIAALDESLRAGGSRLILRRGRAATELAKLVEETGAGAVHAIAHQEPWWRLAEAQVARHLDLRLHPGNTLAPPEAITNAAGEPFQIFSAFWRALSAEMPPSPPARAPSRIPAPSRWPVSDRLDDWVLRPTRPDWSIGFGDWTPGEAGAKARLARFVARAADYADARDRPSAEGTSRLSPHLHFGEISSAQVWHAVPQAQAFLRELVWRDFSRGVIAAMPDYGDRNGRARFDRLEWRSGAAAMRDFRAWTKGMTGYPIVDAGMRQLWATGWMHNRVRMIVASFLTKHLLIDWRRGERWFWDTLVDADYGNNSVNWQWVSGTGIDSNPFGRIMAPLLQSRKFDAAGYIRRWVPELAAIGDEAIHDPHDAGCAPPGYPEKIIGHREGRARALAAGREV